MKRLTLILLSLLALTAKADEGMWVMGNLSAKTDSILRSLGLELTPEELYSTETPSLNDAIVQLNIPTGTPLVYELNDDLTPIKHYYLGDAEAIAKAQQAVANQGKKQ